MNTTEHVFNWAIVKAQLTEISTLLLPPTSLQTMRGLLENAWHMARPSHRLLKI